MESTLDPKDWGWRLEDASLVPVITIEKASPDELLKMRRCNCRMMLKNLSSGKSVLSTPMDLSV